MTNYNRLHIAGDVITSIGLDSQMTVGDIRNAIAKYPDDAIVKLSPCDCGDLLRLTGFDDKGPEDILFTVSCREMGD